MRSPNLTELEVCALKQAVPPDLWFTSCVSGRTHVGCGDDHVLSDLHSVEFEPLTTKPALHRYILIVPYVEFPAEIVPLVGAVMAGHTTSQMFGISESVVLVLAK